MARLQKIPNSATEILIISSLLSSPSLLLLSLLLLLLPTFLRPLIFIFASALLGLGWLWLSLLLGLLFLQPLLLGDLDVLQLDSLHGFIEIAEHLFELLFVHFGEVQIVFLYGVVPLPDGET